MLTAALLIPGPLLLLLGVLDLVRRRRSAEPDAYGTGTVIACERRSSLGSDQPMYGLRVVFTTPTGETVEFADDSRVARLVGTDVAVRHAPEAPWSAHVTETGPTRRPYSLMSAGVLITIGLVAALMSGALRVSGP